VVVPGVLRHFDLPDVAGLVAPRKLLLLNAVDQLHRRAEPGEVQRVYQTAVDAYRSAGSGSALQIGAAASAAEIIARYRALASE